jgi:hypothetical protein
MKRRDARGVTRDATEVTLSTSDLLSESLFVCRENETAVMTESRLLLASAALRITHHASRLWSTP